MTAEAKLRVWRVGTVFLVMVVAGVNIVHVARRMPPAPRDLDGVPANRVMRHEQRLAGVRAALQSRGVHGTLGYVSDLPPEKMPGDAGAMEDYFLSQFVLVPWVLEAKYDVCDWAVANLRTNALAPGSLRGFHVVQDFGGGVLLLQKGAR